ncbi:MAG: MFS transporter [Oscillochloris sp.]|nr:MFS transporter [Oscillochloris sp.]
MVGYVQLLRQNRNFRRLWYGQIVSQLGDWLDSIALFTLLLNLTGSGEAVGLLLVAEFLPSAIVGPFAGVLIDRLPRRLVLIATDLGRAGLVLLLLIPQSAGDIWIVYTAVALKMSLSAFFEPARSAIIPSLCSREELVAANAISGATWSAMLAIGAALGGLVAGTLGVQAAFLLDSATFLLSAALIATIRQEQGSAKKVQEPGTRNQGAGTGEAGSIAARTGNRAVDSGVRSTARLALGQQFSLLGSELFEGLHFIVSRPAVAWLTFTKALWSVGAGALLLLTLYGRELFPLGRDGAISIGLLYAARGIGTGIGPLVALRVGGTTQAALQRAVALGFLVTGVGYFALSGAPILAVAMLCTLFAHIGGSIQWVFSTALLQMRVPDHLLGRVFAIEYAGMTLATATSSYLIGVAHDGGFSPRSLTLVVAAIFGAGALMIWAGYRSTMGGAVVSAES